MNGRHLAVVTVVAIVALVAAFWATTVREPLIDDIGAPLLAGLEQDVNEVSALRIYAGDDDAAVSLVRTDSGWQVTEKAGYRADTAKVRKLLLELASARVIEEKTSNPAYYPRIGVQDNDGDNVRLEFEGVELAPLIVGNLESAREAVYVRRASEAVSWLASGAIAVPTEPLQWLDREIIDLPQSRIAMVEIQHPDGEIVRLSKRSFGQQDFDVANVPDGRSLKRDNVANPVAAALAGLRFDEVAAADADDGGETVQIRLHTFDGLVLNVDAWKADNQAYARLRASTDAATAARFQQAAVDAGDDAVADGGDVADTTATAAATAATSAETTEAAAPDMGAVADEASRLNASLDGWRYTIPMARYDQLTRRLADFLADAE